MSTSVRLNFFIDVHGAVNVGHASNLAEQINKFSKFGHLAAMFRMSAADIFYLFMKDFILCGLVANLLCICPFFVPW